MPGVSTYGVALRPLSFTFAQDDVAVAACVLQQLLRLASPRRERQATQGPDPDAPRLTGALGEQRGVRHPQRAPRVARHRAYLRPAQSGPMDAPGRSKRLSEAPLPSYRGSHPPTYPAAHNLLQQDFKATRADERRASDGRPIRHGRRGKADVFDYTERFHNRSCQTGNVTAESRSTRCLQTTLPTRPRMEHTPDGDTRRLWVHRGRRPPLPLSASCRSTQSGNRPGPRQRK